MKRCGTALALALTLALAPAFPGAGSASEESLAGRWSGTAGEIAVTLLLDPGGEALLLSGDGEGVEAQAMSWDPEPGVIVMRSGGDVRRLAYTLEGGRMTAWDEDGGDAAELAWEEWRPPQGLAGRWEGRDAGGAFRLDLGEDNRFSFFYLSGERLGDGLFAAYGDTLYLAFTDHEIWAYGYALDGDALTIASGEDAFPLARAGALPMATQAPALTAAPGWPPPSRVVGAWIEDGALGTTLLYLGGYGSYLFWRSWLQFVESGTYSADGGMLALAQYEGPEAAWAYALSGDVLRMSARSSGATLTLHRFDLGVPQALLGYWEGEDEEYGPYEISIMDNSEFDEFYFDDLSFYQGILIANETTVALGYPDGYVLQADYRLTGSGLDEELRLYSPRNGELMLTLRRPAPQAAPDP